MGKYKVLIKNELKRIGSDNLLLLMALYPILLVIMGRYLVPFLRESFLSPTFDLANHYPAILVFFILANPYVYGAMAAFMVLDDREERTLQAIQVTPIKVSEYLSAKISLVVIISIITGVIITLFLDLFPITFIQALVINILISLAAPFNMILINNFAKNKVEGFAVVKGTGVLIMLPLAAFYIPEKFNLLAGIIPGYWPAMAINKIVNPDFGFMPYWGYSLFGLVYIVVLIVAMYKKFSRKLVK